MTPKLPLAVVLAAVLATAGCSPGTSEIDGTDFDFEWIVVNNSDESIFIVIQRADRDTGVTPAADPAHPNGVIMMTVLPGERGGTGVGNKVVGDTPGGCFDGTGRWVVRSRSGQTTIPWNTPVDEYLNDLEVLTYTGSRSICTTQDEVVWVFNGTPTTTD